MQIGSSQVRKHYGNLFAHRTGQLNDTEAFRPGFAESALLDTGATIDAPNTVPRGGQIAIALTRSQSQWACDFVVRGETCDPFPRWAA